MSASIERTLFAHGLIIVGACVGSWFMFVQPKTKDLQQLQATITDTAPPEGELNAPTLEAAVKRMKAVRDRVTFIQHGNSLAGDSSKLYGEIMDLAAQNHVTVHNIQPGTAKEPGKDAGWSAMRIDLSAEGSFEDLAGFLEAMNNVEGFIRPSSLNLSPLKESDTPRLTIRFACEALTFKMPEALTALGETHGQP
jgi:hypothetical protein